ncbi:MAG: hypothetical protein NVSMB13_04420 [Mycobacteriales bacterium]
MRLDAIAASTSQALLAINEASADPTINTVWMWGALLAGALATMLQTLTGIDDRGATGPTGPDPNYAST